MKTYLALFLEYFKVGLFAVGGGMATIPFLRELAVKYPWFDLAELSDMIAVSESTPGPIGVNMATFAGYKAGLSVTGSFFGGLLGGILATLGIVCPAIIIICIVSGFMEKFKTNTYVAYAFYGIRPAVAGLIAGAMADVFLMAVVSYTADGAFGGFRLPALLLYAVITAVYAKWNKVHPLFFILAGAVCGILLKL